VFIIDKEHNDSINEQLKRFENLKQKLEASPELQKQMNNNLDKIRRQNRLIHSDPLWVLYNDYQDLATHIL
jgi:hypothetical protein